MQSLLTASQFVETIQERQGYKLACLEEIAFNNGWLSFAELSERARSLEKTSYGPYLQTVLINHTPRDLKKMNLRYTIYSSGICHSSIPIKGHAPFRMLLSAVDHFTQFQSLLFSKMYLKECFDDCITFLEQTILFFFRRL